ncbi:MAG: T9SS type A sorting domain-containing protein [Bacteroidetes bacterium]|nr:T9SS type A sorting domain-containing protein [Bacteroidota bacterium]
MKRTLLACGLALSAWAANAQIATYVLQPPSISGPLTFMAADSWGALPDLSLPANRVQGYAAIVRDGSAADSLGCGTLTNAAQIAGKIAIVYRGTCEFGAKALNAQTAGAIAVVIVNNAGGPVGMAGGASGSQVHIPVVMIGQADGALIHDQVMAGNVELLIGTVLNMFPNNLAMEKSKTLIPEQAARPALVSANENEFSVQLGAWVYNYGTAAQDGATLKATVTHGGTTVYDETSSPASIPSGDSVYFTLPTFAQAGYSGRYALTYTAQLTTTDDFAADNTYATTLTVDTLLSYSPEGTDGLPQQIGFYKPNSTYQSYGICAYFQDANAHRLRAEGIYAAASVNSPLKITDRQLTIRMLELNSDGTTNEVMSGEYVYTDSTLNSQVVYIPFFDPTVLVDGQEYMFCANASDLDMFLGHTNTVNYEETEATTGVVTTRLSIDDAWSRWTTGEVPALGVKMRSATVGINEINNVEITPYPNPTANRISIPVAGQSGKATVQVFDAKGAKVADEQVTVGGNNILSMDLGSLTNGLYTFHLVFNSGTQSSFRVAVSK